MKTNVKKSQAARAVLRILKKWRGCTPDMKISNEIIDKLQEFGMSPPMRKIDHRGKTEKTEGDIEIKLVGCKVRSWRPEND